MTPGELDEWLAAAYTRTSPPLDVRRQGEMGTSWKRYYVEGDEVKVEHIDPRTVYYEDVSDDPRVAQFESGNGWWWPNDNNDRRFMIVGGNRIGRSYWREQLREMITDPLPPYVRYRDPQTHLTPVAAAVKIALDGSVN